MKRPILIGGFAAVVAWPLVGGTALAQSNCSNATLRGSYAFTVGGETLGLVDTPNQVLPLAVRADGVAMTWFDGKGKLSQVDYVMKGGIKRPGNGADNGFDSDETGTYQVFPDCTGTFRINSAAQNYLVTRFVAAERDPSGRADAIHTVVSEQHLPNGTPVGDLTCSAVPGCDLLVQIRSDGYALDRK